jgi:XRE family transcriptional regulator, fatty acid utilization regulator
MSVNSDKVKIIFGLKIRQLRLDKKLSLSEVAEKSNLSISYLNEIEKGKKYPKTDKIMALS